MNTGDTENNELEIYKLLYEYEMKPEVLLKQTSEKLNLKIKQEENLILLCEKVVKNSKTSPPCVRKRLPMQTTEPITLQQYNQDMEIRIVDIKNTVDRINFDFTSYWNDEIEDDNPNVLKNEIRFQRKKNQKKYFHRTKTPEVVDEVIDIELNSSSRIIENIHDLSSFFSQQQELNLSSSSPPLLQPNSINCHTVDKSLIEYQFWFPHDPESDNILFENNFQDYEEDDDDKDIFHGLIKDEDDLYFETQCFRGILPGVVDQNCQTHQQEDQKLPKREFSETEMNDINQCINILSEIDCSFDDPQKRTPIKPLTNFSVESRKRLFNDDQDENVLGSPMKKIKGEEQIGFSTACGKPIRKPAPKLLTKYSELFDKLDIDDEYICQPVKGANCLKPNTVTNISLPTSNLLGKVLSKTCEFSTAGGKSIKNPDVKFLAKYSEMYAKLDLCDSADRNNDLTNSKMNNPQNVDNSLTVTNKLLNPSTSPTIKNVESFGFLTAGGKLMKKPSAQFLTKYSKVYEHLNINDDEISLPVKKQYSKSTKLEKKVSSSKIEFKNTLVLEHAESTTKDIDLKSSIGFKTASGSSIKPPSAKFLLKFNSIYAKLNPEELLNPPQSPKDTVTPSAILDSSLRQTPSPLREIENISPIKPLESTEFPKNNVLQSRGINSSTPINNMKWLSTGRKQRFVSPLTTAAHYNFRQFTKKMSFSSRFKHIEEEDIDMPSVEIENIKTKVVESKNQLSFRKWANVKTLQRFSFEELINMGIRKEVIQMTMKSTLQFTFVVNNNNRSSIIDDIVIPHEPDGKITLDKITTSFLNSPDINKSLVDPIWVLHHLRLIIIKLAAYERSFPTKCSNQCLTLNTTICQLKSRYNREIIQKEYSAVYKIAKKLEDSSARCLVLYVAEIHSDQSLLLSDGWYCIRATVDQPMRKAIKDSRITIGTKLICSGCEIINHETACSPLPHFPKSVSMKLMSNSTRRVRWDTKLGFLKTMSTLPVRLDTVLSNGGRISSICVYILRVYPEMCLETRQNHKTILRNEQKSFIDEDKNVKSKISLRKIRVVDGQQPQKIFMLWVWKPDESFDRVFIENHFVDVTNLKVDRVKSEVQIQTTKSSKYRIAPVSLKHKKPVEVLTRQSTNISVLELQTFKPVFGEFDVVGLIIYIGPNFIKPTYESIYVADHNENILCINSWTTVHSIGYSDVIKNQTIVCIKNLQWRKQHKFNLFPTACITEFTSFEVAECNEFQTIDINRFVESCNQKLNRLSPNII